MKKEEYLLRLSMLEQEANKIEEQIGIINQQISELEVLKLSLKNLSRTEEKEVLAPLGRGIFFKSELKEKELFVNVGREVVVKKSPEETAEIIEVQVSQMRAIKEHLISNITEVRMQLEDVVEQARQEN
ncbi:MAG: prefoldin subunit alpha [Nanoarchaeota archaeon]